MRAGPALDRRADADYGVGFVLPCGADNSIQRGVAGMVENVAEFPDLAAREGFQRAENTAARLESLQPALPGTPVPR